jgi:hypothetical protein
MWFFDGIGSSASNLASWLDNAGSVADSIPAVGSYLGYPFHAAAMPVRNIASYAQSASSWADGVANTASAAYSNALTVYNYAYGTLTSSVNNALNTANSAWNYASNTVWNLANSAWLKAQAAYDYASNTVWSLANSALARANEALNYASGWLKSQVDTLTNTFWSQINAINTWKNGFVSDFWGQINAISTWKNDILSKIPTSLNVVDWVESSLGYLTGKAIALITANAASFAGSLWGLLEAVLKNIQLPER